MKDITGWSDGFIMIWWYPEYASRKHIVFRTWPQVSYLVYVWQGEGIFLTHLIKGRVVDIHLPLPVLLVDLDRID